jgi:FkbM family methyltransferase
MERRSGVEPRLDSDAGAIRSNDEFVNCVLQSILNSNSIYGQENVDPEYPADGAVPGTHDPLEKRLAYLKFFLNNSVRLYRAFKLLEDIESKQLFLSLILFRLLGYRRVWLPLDHEAYFVARQRANSIDGFSNGRFVCGLPFRHFEFTHEDRRIVVDCLQTNLFFSFFTRQYYFRRAGITIEPRPGDTIVDAGACFGDTAISFAHSVGSAGHVYSFDVLQSHLDIIGLNLTQNPQLSNITVFPVALTNRDHQGSTAAGEPNPGYTTTEAETSRSLDSLVADGTIPRVDFIKMDIEGGELRALEGASATIQRFRPRLAISIYHRPEDYYAIPEFIHKLGAGYKMYIANYTLSDGETILYAVSRKRPSK